MCALPISASPYHSRDLNLTQVPWRLQMKMLLTAIALTIATPALAQTANPANAHAGHGQMSTAQAKPSTDPHAGHNMGGMMNAEAMKAHCEKMKAEGKAMEGCNMQGSKAKADPHAGHNMSQK